MPDVMKTVGRYEILREVGRGGMAMVYLARQTDLDRFVALKELGAFHASDPSFAQRFLRESRVAGSLSHPNICTVHDYFEHDGTPYIAMEYIERGSLRPYVGTMNQAQIGGVLEGLLAGLAHGEQHGIVHRDLKPENLMVTSDGRVKIADFGIAKATNQMQTGAFLTATGTTVGTPTYMAPEQAMAQDIGPPTDLYSVGCMAFEMYTGRVPFHDTEAPMAILLRHVNEQIPAVKSVDPSIDQDVSDWIERMLVKDPTKRTQSANDAWDEFEEIIIGLLGPRWRREARLREGSAQFDTPAPLTPAPFKGTTSDAAVSDQFQSFAWGNAVTPEAPPGPDTPPPSDAAPLPPEPTVGPPTPAPGPAVASDGAAPPESDAGFVTFGAPALPEAADVAQDEPPAAEAAAPPEAEAEAAVEDEAPATEPQEEESGGFETYIAPAPLRPPTDDAPSEAPAIPEPTPEPEPVPEPTPDPEPVAVTPPPPAPAPTPPPAPTPAPPLRGLDDEDDLAKTVMPASVKPPVADPTPTPTPEPAVEKPVPVAEEPEEPKEKSGGGKGVLIGIGVAVVIAAIVGFLAGGSGGNGESGGGAPTRRGLQRRRRGAVPQGLDQGQRTADPRHDLRLPGGDEAARRQGRRDRRVRPGQAGREQPDAAAGRLPRRARPRRRRGPAARGRPAEAREPAGVPLQDAAPERARRRGHALHRPHLRGHRHARVRGPGRGLRGDRRHVQAQGRHGVPGRAEQGVRGRGRQGARRPGQEGLLRAQGAPEREDPEGAGVRGGRARLGVQGRVGGDLEARRSRRPTPPRTRRSPPRSS